MKKIEILGQIAMIAMLPYVLTYPYQTFKWQLEMAFLNPERWETSSWVEQGAQISMLTRCLYFSLWAPSVICGMVALFFAYRICFYFKKGIVFDSRIANSILALGAFISASSAIHLCAASLSPMIVSWHNPSGPLPLRFWYTSEHLGLIFCGMGFVMLGAVMREAIVIARENESYV